jgi:expansin (peptidoglycan-binding protein)
MMKSIYRISWAFGIILAGVSTAYASAYDSIHTGQGTFYGYSGGGNCSIPFPSTVLTAAMNTTDYNTSEACGAYVEVTNLNTSKKVVVRIDDQCPGCSAGHVDLAQTAFAQISPISAGVIPISWRYVDGPSTPAVVYFKEGSSQWWAAIQVRNHRNPVASVAYRQTGSGGAYTTLSRQMYNYFLAPGGMGAGPFDLQITDVFGQVLNVTNIPLTITTDISLGTQFPAVLPAGGSSSSSDTSSSSQAATVSISTSSDWGQGYCNNVAVTNPNAFPLTWTVSFNVTGTVYTFWNANLVVSGSSVTATGVSWNQTLAAGATATFGYCANR